MVDEIGLDKPKVDKIYYAILHPNLISNSYEWKIGSLLLACCQPTFHGHARCLKTSSRVVNRLGLPVRYM